MRLGQGPFFLAENLSGKNLFVSNNNSDVILEIDPKGKKIISIIKIERPRNLVFDHIQHKLFVIHGKSNWLRFNNKGKQLSIIDTKSKKIIKTIGNNEGFSGIDIDVNSSVVYAVQSNPKKIIWINSISNEIIQSLKIKEKPKGIFFNSNTSVIIENNNGKLVSIYDLEKRNKIKNIEFNKKGNTTQLVIDPHFNRIYLRKHEDFYMEGGGGFSETGYAINILNDKTTCITKEIWNSNLVFSNLTKKGVFFCQKENNEFIIYNGSNVIKKFRSNMEPDSLIINLGSNLIYISFDHYLGNYLYIFEI